MKSILLKVVKNAELGGQIVDFSYKRQLVEIFKAAPLGGADLDELRRSIHILDALDHAEPEGVLQLEDADCDHLKARVLAVKWPMIDRVLLQFIEDVTNPKE